MAGIDPATGKFDPYYNGGENYFAGAGVTSGGYDYNAKTNTFKNNGTGIWTMSGPDGGPPQGSSTASGSDGGGGGGDQPPAEDPYTKYLREEAARLERIRTMNARVIMESQMAAYGLGGLAKKITGWITEGYEPEAIMALVRQTEEYATRFPAMKGLQAKGQSISESEYIAYEQTMTQYEKLFGLPKDMLSGKDMVTKSLLNGLSAREVEERATRASASIYQLPKAFRDTMQQYYGIDSGGLTAFFLDPEAASPMLEKQYVAAQIGMEAAGQGMGIAAEMAERLYQFGVDRGEARQGFGEVASQQGLKAGKGETVDQSALIDANLIGDAGAVAKVTRVGKSRRGRFEGGGGFMSDKSGVSGIGSASS